MKKITCILLLIQSGLMMAQTKTVVSPNGEKVKINVNTLNTANNGLTGSGNNVQLGGDLTKSTAIITSSTNTLAIKGLQSGSVTDSIVVASTNGALKNISQADAFDNLGNHIATKDLEMSEKDIKDAANITATGKTKTNIALIAKGTDESLPVKGSIVTSADANGNIIWKEPDVEGVTTAKLVGVAKVGTSIANLNATSKVWFDTVSLDPENNFSGNSTTGSVYTVPKNGLYQFFVNYTAYTGSTTFELIIYRNTSPISIMTANTAAGASAVVFAINNFAKGDKISVMIYGTVKGAQANLTKLSVFRFE